MNLNFCLCCAHLVLLLGDNVDNGVDDHGGPVDGVGQDVEGRLTVALISLVITGVKNKLSSLGELFHHFHQ